MRVRQALARRSSSLSAVLTALACATFLTWIAWAAAGNANRGRPLFRKTLWRLPHSRSSESGSPLRTVFATRCRKGPGFAYSEALSGQGSRGTSPNWTSGSRSRQRRQAQRYVVPLENAGERADIIAYFKQLSGEQHK